VVRARWLLLAGTLLGAGLASWLALTTASSYVATAKVSVVDIEDPGGVSPDDRRASEVLTLVEHGFVMGTTRDNYNEVMLARLRSRSFTMHFLDTHNLYRISTPSTGPRRPGAGRTGSPRTAARASRASATRYA
jgi:hypothetical protein